MLKFKFKQLLAEKEFNDGQVVTITDVAKATGINRMTLSKIANKRGYSTVTDNIDKLCAYFECEVGDLVEYVKE
ncbi:helix-turn-helix domain-containing protein [Glaciecola sp. XM2]|jgi:putative transcriptional regulator|uniref:helix-turn-helix domain-containing protein n=1 Tax=Glaciecola sp. XM2 TaxID=1914931 RepID=UPI001BDE9ED3|nr:helix-turn-helix transcriptional regulator [Glaciecola sp. XM2]MBT1449278.1 helix-turn-helix domain-containing protein [Glaciecola sp. XM2]